MISSSSITSSITKSTNTICRSSSSAISSTTDSIDEVVYR